MVRRDAIEREASQEVSLEVVRCASPAGASPAPESAGAPGSRPQATLERAWSQAGRQEPVRRREPRSGEQARGPQHQVKPAASTEEQSGSRADHVAAKATSAKRAPERNAGPGGVWGAARVQGEARNTRDPSQQPPSRQGGSYKPKAKSSAAERGSEGTVLVTMAATNNATGAKGPCGGRVVRAGKREGMAAKSGPNDPGGLVPREKVRQLQRRLCAVAKRQPGRRILERLGLELHPDKTRRVELYDGKQGFDFLGCHLHKRMSGSIWERKKQRVYFLHRWPSRRSMQRIRQRVKELTPSGRCHADVRDVIKQEGK
jgi:hypothetical protein